MKRACRFPVTLARLRSAAHGGGDPGQSAVYGRQVSNRRRTDFDLVDPANTAHRQARLETTHQTPRTGRTTDLLGVRVVR